MKIDSSYDLDENDSSEIPVFFHSLGVDFITHYLNGILSTSYKGDFIIPAIAE